jgi:hypothetical protein
MSIIGSNILAGAAGSGVSAYEIEQSLRFNSADSTVLSLAASTSNTSTKFTFSFWMKPAKIGGATGDVGIWRVEGPNSSESAIQIGYNWNAIGDAKIGCYWHQAGTGNNWNGGGTNAVYRDPSAWYHFVIAIDTTQASGPDRFKVYANGVLQDRTFDPAHYIPQNYAAQFNAYTQKIGEGANFYLAEFYLIRDQALAPTDFGEFDDNGVWRPIEYAAAYGSKDIYFKFESSGVGTDSSGNGNNFSPSGFSTSGTGTDVMSDTPTTNWATLNPLNVNILDGATLTNGNLQLNASSIRYANAKSTFVASQFNNYCEVDITTRSGGSLIGIGVGDATANIALGAGNFTTYREVGEIRVYPGNVLAGTVASYTQGDVIGMAIDSTNVKFYKNGTLQGTYAHSLTGDYFAVGLAYNDSASTVIDFNFGQRAFAYTPPTGYKALNTANLPEPDIADGSQYFDTKLYTANNQTAQTITGLGFSPDLLWFKPRSRAEHHYLYDQVRGAGNRISSSQTIAEITGDNSLTAFTSDGFSLGVDGAGIVNYGTDSMVAWAWDAGGTGSSNTDGTITSTVSANPTAGFSIATYTGNGTAGATVGHGLGVAPRMIMVKRRDTGTDWAVYHASTGATKYLTLNNTNSAGTSSAYWNNTEPTSTLFSLGLSGEANTNGGTFVAYCFAEVEGYSKFGSYTGNGSASGDGTFVYLGFRPAFFMIKGPSGFDWYLFDNQRPGYNEKTYRLFPNLASSENVDQVGCDFVSNGVKLRSGNANVSSAVYYYAAFGENPFGGSGVSPATAR